jgi:hypothetical protein
MSLPENYDLTYATIDSLAEGVGGSQITPIISQLSKTGMKINLISFEKLQPSNHLIEQFKSLGVTWNAQPFGSHGLIGGAERLNRLRKEIPKSSLIHARSDIPAVAGIASHEAPVLWDVRSLWADQKVMIQKNFLHASLYSAYRGLESISARKSMAMSTLTDSVVPVLENRHKRLPELRTVVPTIVNLDSFKLVATFPSIIKVLFSGSYNDYYDLALSERFLSELRKLVTIEIHWARPKESIRSHIGLGEEKIIPAMQSDMASLIPNYSFGVSVCKLDAGPSLRAAMPTKIAEFLACGRPIVVNKGLGDMDAFIKEFNAGVILDGTADNLRESAESLVALISDPQTSQRCRNLAEKYFNLEVGAERYFDMYQKMLLD